MTDLNHILAPIAEKFGFDPKDTKIQEAMEYTKIRFKEKIEQEFNPADDAHILLLRREFLYTLRLDTYSKECRDASEKIIAKPLARETLSRRIEEEISPGGTRSDPGYFFDPAKWNVARISAHMFEEKISRLVLFCSAMSVQEANFRDESLSYLDIARAVVQLRADARDNPPDGKGTGRAFRG